MTVTHELKTLNIYWDAVASGEKTFEVRKNDKAFQKGDVIVLNRTDLTGRHDALPKDKVRDSFFAKSQLCFRITYVLQGGQFGIEPTYCVLGLMPITEKDQPND